MLQSNYIPWKGYFDLMGSADVFVVYDSVQYTKNDWRNRNLLNGPNGSTWLTIPVQTAGRSTQRIDEASVADGRWARKHWMTILQVLGKRPYFNDYRLEWEDWYTQAYDLRLLHDINLLFLTGLARQLSISTTIVNASEFNVLLDATSSSATERVVELCSAAQATTYITGPAGLAYMELKDFQEAGIAVEVIDYGRYQPYPQSTEPFIHGVSTLDLLASVGPTASTHLTSCTTVLC